jgi:hypothetical protein
MKAWSTDGNVTTPSIPLTESQVAERLGLSVATLRAWRHRVPDRGSCVSGARSGTWRRTSTSSSARARLTRVRFPRQMKSHEQGSCGYESLETWTPVLDRLHRSR